MSCNHRLLSTHLWDYLEDELPAPLRARLEDALTHCPDCRETLRLARELEALPRRWREQEVPPWPRQRHLPQAPGSRGRSMQWASLAFSCLALLLVLFEAELRVEDGIHLSFGGQQREARLLERLEVEFAAWQRQRDRQLEQRLADYARDQGRANELQLVNWLERSRRERREDLDLLFAAWEVQRFEDRSQLDRRLDYLASSQLESDLFLSELLQTLESPNTRQGDLR